MDRPDSPLLVMTKPPGTLQSFAAILKASRKRPGVVTSLSPVCWVRPEVRLSKTEVDAYAKVCGFSAGHGVPLLYPQMLTFPLAMAYFASVYCPWPAMGTVHLANRVRQYAALNLGDVLRVELRPGDLQVHEKGQIFKLEFQIFRDAELVWEATQTLLRMGVQRPAGEAYVSALHSEQALSLQTLWSAQANIGRRYGRISGDMNPIHLTALSARVFGFRRAIAHGLWTKARALSALLPQVPLAQADVLTEFKTPLFLPATASLWSTRALEGPMAHNALFDVRNAKGDKPHLRASLSYSLA